MALASSAEDVAGILDQIYRVANGRPQRFWLRSEDLKDFARRRSLRSEFFDQVAWRLECRFSILMSYPRLSQGGTLGFASSVIIDRWPTVSEENFQKVLCTELGSQWAPGVLRRIKQLYGRVDERAQESSNTFRPMTISGEQFCSLVEETNFRNTWWSELINRVSNAPDPDRFVFFYHGPPTCRVFALVREDYIKAHWRRPETPDWAAALVRYNLDETE